MKKTDLSELPEIALVEAGKIKIGLAVARWNEEVTGALCKAAIKTLEHYGVVSKNIEKVEVPGSFELPMGARALLKNDKFDAVICLGCVIKGETPHNDYINHAVSTGLMNLSLSSGTPCIFGVLTPLNMDQALARAGGGHGNKGVEAAVAALQMVSLNKGLHRNSKSIGF